MAHDTADVKSELVDLTGIPLDQLRSSADPVLAGSVSRLNQEAESLADPVRMSSSKNENECPGLAVPDAGNA